MRSSAFYKNSILIIYIILLVVLPFSLTAQTKYPTEIELVLQKTTNNRMELEKAIQHFAKKGDSLQLKAVFFLIANMDIHSSYNYFWLDQSGKKVPFNELSYPNFEASLQAFDYIKRNTVGIHPQPFSYKDIDSINADYLVENVEYAFEAWKSPWAKNLNFADFCEYILPYRASLEPLQKWRKVYQQKFAWINDSAKSKPIDDALIYLGNDVKKWFLNTYNRETSKEPLPRLGALQLLSRKKGPCEDVADLALFALRSQGIPVTNDIVTFWATSSGSHFFNSTLNSKNAHIRFDVSTATVRLQTFAREPAKVIRVTYAKQPETLASKEPIGNIPNGFMQNVNYIDVTNEYWPVKDVKCNLFATPKNTRIVYVCVFNFLNWRPTWWGNVTNNTVVFHDMCKGAVFLPVYYANGKIIPAGYPVASGYDHVNILQPDTLHKRSITIDEQSNYLAFKPGHIYKLYYWDNAWKLLGLQKAVFETKKMLFEKVPENALLLLYPDDTQYKERPFMITKEGQRVWW